MARTTLACIAVLSFSAAAYADGSVARFEGGIGSQPLRAGGTPNLVFGAAPGGVPWVISQLSADVKSDGRISVAGRGLLVGGGNGIGTNANQSVHARLLCNGIPFETHALVPLEADGDFRIDDTLVPPPPANCAPATLLIINGSGSWFAAGIPKL